MKILVTGGAGFIGNHLAKFLVKEGHAVTVVDNLIANSDYIVPDKINFIKADLRRNTTFRKIPGDIDIVFHLASQASGESSFDNPIFDLESNSLVTLKLLNWSKNINVKKFIFTSTMGVYKDNLNIPVKENDELAPKNFYGISKMMSEKHISIFNEEGMKTLIFRLFNVFGPGQNLRNMKQGMISIYISYLLKDQNITVKGPLSRVRDFVFIDDVISALNLGMESDKHGRTYNVCNSRQITVKEAVNTILSMYNSVSKKDVIIEKRTPRDIDSIWGNNDKIINEINWKPNFTFEEGLKKTIEDIKNAQRK